MRLGLDVSSSYPRSSTGVPEPNEGHMHVSTSVILYLYSIVPRPDQFVRKRVQFSSR